MKKTNHFFVTSRKLSGICFVLGLVFASNSEAQTWSHVATVRSADTNNDDNHLFGESLSISKGSVLVGSAYEHDGVGAAYLFSGDQFDEMLLFDAAGEESFSYHGASVSIDGDTFAVGSMHHSGLDVNIFVNNGGEWQFQQSVGEATSSFGHRVVLHDNILVVSAPQVDGAAGVVYSYALVDGTWTLQKEIVASDAKTEEYFGYDLAFDGETLVVGAPGNLIYPDERAGIYVYAREGDSFGPEQRLSVPNGPDIKFGANVDVEGDHLTSGGVVFRKQAGGWEEEQTLAVPDGLIQDVKLQGDTLYAQNNSETENVIYIFEYTGDMWQQAEEIALPLAENYWTFAINGGTLAVGHYGSGTESEVLIYRNLEADTQEVDPNDSEGDGENEDAAAGTDGCGCAQLGTPTQQGSLLFLLSALF